MVTGLCLLEARVLNYGAWLCVHLSDSATIVSGVRWEAAQAFVSWAGSRGLSTEQVLSFADLSYSDFPGPSS